MNILSRATCMYDNCQYTARTYMSLLLYVFQLHSQIAMHLYDVFVESGITKKEKITIALPQMLFKTAEASRRLVSTSSIIREIIFRVFHIEVTVIKVDPTSVGIYVCTLYFGHPCLFNVRRKKTRLTSESYVTFIRL